MRKYTAKKYVNFVENIKDAILQNHMKAEIKEIRNVKDSKNKTFIDLGAGYGRILHVLTEIARNVISIDINPDMLSELKRRTKKHENTEVIDGDITKLSILLQNKEVQRPVLLLLQNTLGTIEGDWKKVLFEMKKVAKERGGEIIISLFRQESLRSWGINLYSLISELVGEPDLEKTDVSKGLFVSKTGYTSKWWNKKEIENIKKYFGDKVINEIWTKEYYIIHIGFY